MPAVLAGIPPGNAVFDPFKDLSGLAAGKVGFSLDGLNDRQKEAITFLDSPIMVFAGPGSGKTRVLTFRVAYLLDAGVAEEPFQVLALTFTNKAADEMNDRIEKLIGSLKGRVWAGTFHSLCHRILRAYGPYISLAPNFTIVDDADRMEMIQDCLERARLLNRIPPMQALDEIGRFKNEMILPEQLASDPSSGRRAMGAVFADYQKRLANNGMIDFDDLMLLTIRLFQEHPTLCRIYQDAFPHILIDEYQDTNVAQMELLKLLAVRTRSLCAVADDDQSIYCWRGAQPQNIRAFIEHFGAEKVYLEKNHRSPQPIIDAAIAVVERNSSHEEKQLYGNPPREEFCIFGHLAGTMEKEAAFVAREIRGLLDAGCSPQEIAILFRTRHNSLFVLEQELVKAGVPCTRAGRDYSAPQQDLKGMADYLHIIHSEHNSRALRRVLASGLSKDDLNALGRFYRDCKYRHLFDAVELL